MIFYIESENYVRNQCDAIISDLVELEKNEHKKIEIILSFLTKFDTYIQSQNDINNAQYIIEMLETLKSLSDALRKNRNNLKNLKKFLNDLFPEDIDVSLDINDDTKSKIVEYNKIANECKNKLFSASEQFENFIMKYIQCITFLDKSTSKQFVNSDKSNIQQTYNSNLNAKEENTSIAIDESKNENTIKDNSKSEIQDSLLNLQDNRVLLISETQGKVFLPYNIDDLNTKLQKSKKYRNIQDIINNEYILPISRYRSTNFSRFREGYNLMKNKQNSSIMDSLDLALELAFNSSLHPAIITACNNLDELDTYLDCLEANQLDNFKIFEIKYDILPIK